VAPKEVKTSQIYWGAVPFVAIQVVMVVLVLAFPGLVSIGKDKEATTPAEIKLETEPGAGYLLPPGQR
jgi:hypothetical protein